VRLGIGQLLDYRRHIDVPQLKLSLLLPARPTDDLIDLLQTVGIGCVYEVEPDRVKSGYSCQLPNRRFGTTVFVRSSEHRTRTHVLLGMRQESPLSRWLGCWHQGDVQTLYVELDVAFECDSDGRGRFLA